MIDKILKFLYKFILLFTFISFFIAIVGATFFCVNRSYDYLNPLILIIGSLLAFKLLKKVYNYILSLSDKKKNMLCIILLIVQFCLLFLSTVVIKSVPKVDLIHILTGINSLNNTGTIINRDYFAVYPNNKFLLLILYGINLLGNKSTILFGLFSSLCVTIMSLFTYKTVLKVMNKDKALMSLLMCVLSPIFYLYVSYCYTDIIMLPFASILMYLLVSNNLIKDKKKSLVSAILIGIVAIIGYKIRAVAIFLLIAYLGYLVFKKEFKKIIMYFIPIIFAGVLTLGFIGKLENKVFGNLDKNKEFPLTHWVMMGVNLDKKGYYNQDDYNLSASATNIEERQKINIEQILVRVKKQGVIGNIELLVRKIVTVFGKGDYSYQKYLDLVDDYNVSYRYLLEDENIVLNYLLQISKIVILALALISLIKLYKKHEISIIAIALFGAVIFYLLWEVCPRYGLSFLPWLILLINYAYDNFLINKKEEKTKFYLKYLIFGLSIISLIIGFLKYTKFEERTTLVAKNTVNKIKYVKLNKDLCVMQEIALNDEFNEIKLMFRFNSLDKLDYKLDLLNEEEKVLMSQNFTKDILINEDYTTFKLNKMFEKGNYIIRLSTLEDSDLEVYVAYKEEFDYYNDGILKINDKVETGDLMFEINNVRKRPVYTYLEYSLLTVFVLVGEYIILFKKEGSKNEEKK